MIELTIDSIAFAITPIALSEPCQVVAIHAELKLIDCQGIEPRRVLAPGKPDRFGSPPGSLGGQISMFS
jgi:hypothetical protein